MWCFMSCLRLQWCSRGRGRSNDYLMVLLFALSSEISSFLRFTSESDVTLSCLIPYLHSTHRGRSNMGRSSNFITYFATSLYKPSRPAMWWCIKLPCIDWDRRGVRIFNFPACSHNRRSKWTRTNKQTNRQTHRNSINEGLCNTRWQSIFENSSKRGISN